MPYMINGEVYEIGDERYMIGEQYMIGAPQGAMLAPFAAPQLMPRQGPPMQGVPFYAMPRPTVVNKVDPSRSLLQVLGCNQETNIAVGAVGTATTQPQKVYKPERYVIPSTVAPDFLIDSITIGVDLQSPANVSIPAEAFLPNTNLSTVEFATCQISQQIVVRPRNRGGADRPFFSAFYGRTIF